MNELVRYVQEINPYLGTTIMYQDELFSYWDEGCSRYVFVNEAKTQVIKITKDEISGFFNDDEYQRYQEASEEDRDRMALTDLQDGIIIQEFCMPAKWAGVKLTVAQKLFSERCRNEVGWNAAGELVCFDLDEYMKY